MAHFMSIEMSFCKTSLLENIVLFLYREIDPLSPRLFWQSLDFIAQFTQNSESMLCIECCLDAFDIALSLYLHVFKYCPQDSKWQSVAQITNLGKKMH